MKRENELIKKLVVSFSTSEWHLQWPEPKTPALLQRHSQAEKHCRERGGYDESWMTDRPENHFNILSLIPKVVWE